MEDGNTFTAVTLYMERDTVMQSNDEVHLCSSFILHDYEVREVNEKKIGTQDLLLVQEKKINTQCCIRYSRPLHLNRFVRVNYICLTSLTRAKPKEKMEFPA